MKSSLLSRPKNRLLIDLAIRILLGAAFAFSAGLCFKSALSQMPKTTEAHLLVHTFSVIAISLYMMMVACLYILRLPPVNKFVGVGPSLAALLGGFLMMGIIWLPPRTDLPLAVQVIASFLIFAGNILAIYILTHLGRSFSILPESRQLVTKGPYHFIRHPLYLAEAFGTLGAVMTFWSPAAIALFLAQLGFQVVRMHYEERVLRKSFPAYAAYAKRTARLIPGVY